MVTYTPRRAHYWGKETTSGTAVAATERIILESLDFEPVDEVVAPATIRQFMMRAHGDEHVVRRGTTFTGSGPLAFDQLHSWLHLAIEGNVTASGSGDNRSWAHSRTLTGVPSLNSFTFERRITDGTNHIDNEFAYGGLTALTITVPDTGYVTLDVEGFARRIQASTLTTLTGVDLQPVLEYAVAPRCALYIDDSAGGIGGTQVSSRVLGATLKFETGRVPTWTCDNRTDLDWTIATIDGQNTGVELEVTAMIDSSASATGSYIYEKTKSEAVAVRYVSFFIEGSDIGTGTKRSARFNMAMKHVPGSVFKVGTDNGRDIVTYRLRETSDYTVPWIVATVVNARSAICDGTAAA